MPPEDPRVRGDPGKRSVFYNLLRPEFVKTYPNALCRWELMVTLLINSDAFTSWNSDDNEANRVRNNVEVTQATEYLYHNVIPEYAKVKKTLPVTINF
jgi:hypothetical protein